MISPLQTERSKDPDDGREARARIDALIAGALRGETANWPNKFSADGGPASAGREAMVLERILFHGVAGLLAERRGALSGWPADLLADIRQLAIGQAMWEISHKIVISRAIEALAGAGIATIILKGSALAYDLYPQPAQRARGDTDVLLCTADLDRARSVLSSLGFECESPTDEMVEELEEIWAIDGPDGMHHKLDLHWQTVDAPALEGLLPFETCISKAQDLDAFSTSAKRMDRPMMLMHAIIHRAKHMISPYYVGDTAYHDGDRLIWISDIDLLARALDEGGWSEFCGLSLSYQVAPTCLEAIQTTRRYLATPVPEQVMERLGAAPQSSPQSDYLLRDRQFGRAWKNFLALKGTRRKMSYLRSKLLPSRKFMREKYVHLPGVPVSMLYAWRILELFIPRPRQRGKRGDSPPAP